LGDASIPSFPNRSVNNVAEADEAFKVIPVAQRSNTGCAAPWGTLLCNGHVTLACGNSFRARGWQFMHMAMVIAGGILLLGVFLLFGKLWGGDATGSATAAKIFIPVWLAIAIVNLWVGVSKAGYTVREELPILLIVFALPAAAAALAVWQFSRS
jgi:hypothetical protein